MNMEKRYKILVTNDDGIDSPGIAALAEAMSRLGDVFISAPDRQQSAVGHSLTISQTLRVHQVKREYAQKAYAINGTPSDCVKMALSVLMDETPDLVVSGINHGQNTAINILYSGTVAAATEGLLFNLPSIAFSLASHDLKRDLFAASEYAYRIAKNVLESKPQKGVLLNVNVPVLQLDEIKGIKVVPASNSYWEDTYERREDPFGREYFWFSGEYHVAEDGPDTDDNALRDGYVAITPVHFKFTNYEAIPEYKHLEDLK